MPHVSKRKLSNKTLKEILNAFIYVITKIKREKEMGFFLDSFLSDTEKLMLAKRLAIVFLLSERVGESKIAEILNVTQSTVSRIKLWYENKGSGYKIAISQIKKGKVLQVLKNLSVKTTITPVRRTNKRP